MHSAQARDKIFKSWSGISEITIIKEVATKGEHIEYCIEYWARKRNLTPAEYRHYFYDVVQAYVQRLLSERLVLKAENVIRNVDRDVKCFFYQYACECQNADLSDFVLDHLRCRYSQLYAEEEPILQYYWTLVQQLRECSSLLDKYKAQLPRVHIEALMTLPETTMQRLLVELYFLNENDQLLTELNKDIVWQHLVNTQDNDKLRCWFLFNDTSKKQVGTTPLEQAYATWKIEPTMYEYALDNLKDPCEPIRNYFARAGFIFANDSGDMTTLLRRLCTMCCLSENQDMLSKQPLTRHIIERGHYTLLLLHCVPVEALEQLVGENDPLLELIIDLKSHSLTERTGFETLSKSVQTYLEQTHNAVESIEEHPLLIFYDFLCHEPSIAALESFLSSSNLSRVPYLKSLMLRFDHGPSQMPSLPTPHELFFKFKNINFASLASAAGVGEIASFSNTRLCQRYARKTQLNYTHYLKQHRSAYAVYYFLIEQLQLYGQITRTQLFHVCETVTELALQHAGDKDLVAHCVACCEMLGFDTQHLRRLLLLQKLLSSSTEHSSYAESFSRWDNALLEQLKAKPMQFPLEGYQALMGLAARNTQGCWPAALLQHYAAENDWWHLLVLLQYFDLPLAELKRHLDHFKYSTMGVHLLRALSYDFGSERQHRRARRSDGQTNSSQETITNTSQSSSQDANFQLLQSSASHSTCCLLTQAAQQDLFAIILCSSNNLPDERITEIGRFLELMQGTGPQSTCLNLLKQCVKQQLPILAVLAATVSSQNVDWCWLVWLSVSTGKWSNLLRESSKLNSELEFVWSVIRGAVSGGHVNALLHSFNIFQQNCNFVPLCRFLQLTAHQQDFSDTAIAELRLFFFCWSMDAVTLPLCPLLPRKQLMQRCIGLLLMQLQLNFDCILQQQKFLECICRSDVGDICDLLDFCLLHKAFGVSASWMDKLSINFELLVRHDSPEYMRLVDALTEAKAYSEAVQLVTMLQLPVCDIISLKWVTEYDAGVLHPYAIYEKEIEDYALPPAILVNFFLHAAGQENAACLRKYELLQSALNVIKQHHLFPNESFDRDQIEYDMVLCYLNLPDDMAQLASIYHSEYFEQIMMQERCVLYKSFVELKELAGIDDLSISVASKATLTPSMEQRLEMLLNMLLDKGDIVEALRLQELFEFRPNDLRFIVFSMALAEGVTSIFNLSTKERQLLAEIEKGAYSKFNRLTLNQSLLARCSSDLSDSCSTLEFEEIPPKEKQQTLDTLLGIGSKLKHGVELGKRIVLAYRAAMYLDKEYLDVLRTKDVSVLLKSAAEEDCLQRLMVVSDIHISTRLTEKEIAEAIALELTTCIVRPRFYIFHANQQPRNAPRNADLWGYNIDRDFHLFLELTPNTTILGQQLLDYCDALKAYRRYQDNKPYEESEAFQHLSEIITRYGLPASVASNTSTTAGAGSSLLPQVLSNKKHNQIYVELLIKAHHCFVHECSMEGIANVLHRAKALNTLLKKAKSWSLIVRMLIGIARYREMFYCFDALIENEEFECLLGQFDEGQKCGLRQAIISYLREYNPKNSKELLRLAALHFLMYKELAEMWEQEARDVLNKVRSLSELAAGPPLESSKAQLIKLKCSTEVQALLQQALENYTHATENYLLDNKLMQAQQSVAKAELVAMQIDLCNKALEKRSHNVAQLCVSVISVKTRDEFRELANSELSVAQTLILSRAYSYDINWSEALLSQFVLLQKQNFLNDYQYHQRINDDVIEQVVKGYVLYTQNNVSNAKHQESLSQLVELIQSVTLKYRLASILDLKSIVLSLINSSVVHYLRDTNFGRHESHNVADM
ncbi:spatacsin [Scaptodrosophila lebanonensis]|uniref:Spatacsin n=1 Tax=Drosophila lebanonensis TaxID=7225 RepID=A0A6J2UHI5_DROLE|nr:spatacsin [Scaptodrosophila lebanonensis]